MADDLLPRNVISFEADAAHLERMRKEGHVQGFTMYCDEGQRIGGDGSAPTPLGYFSLSIGF